ncbi:uncharacterized protein [Nicotiana sylvestris]|uniref:uncharacterized protein n=1 Tax=Nicotiana sylvestris TaxID=4096 RepID=UPI00388C8EB2
MVTVVYASIDSTQRNQLWKNLIQIESNIQVCWLLSGDFNNVLHTDDRIGTPVTQAETQGFQDMINTLQLSQCNQSNQQRGIHPKPFKLYGSVMEHLEFKGIVERVWKQDVKAEPMQRIWLKLKMLKVDLKDLNTYMDSYKYQLNQARYKLEIIQNQLMAHPLDQNLIDQERLALAETEKWIYNDNGVKLTDPVQVENEFISFFTKLMGKGGNVHKCPNAEVIHQGPCLTLQQKEELVQEVTRVEILNAIKDMPHEKAPGVYDFPIEFFTKHWQEVGNDIYYLLMFCKADIQSIRLLNQTFLKFSEASGLQANSEKSSIYLAGISNAQRQDILQELGYPEGTLPFKAYTTNQISFVWDSIILGTDLSSTKKSDEMVESICRSFLWTGTSSVSKKALVSWDKVCLPQVVGGLNVINMVYWNKAAVAKHLWVVAKKKECLWIRWIHTFYIKQNMLEHMPIPKNAAWVVRKILETRKFIGEVQGLQGDLMSRLGQLQKGNSFSIKKLYRLQFSQLPKVFWKGIVLQPNLYPRFKFILWLALQRRLATIDRLLMFGVQIPQQCIFYKRADEVFDHIFFECTMTKEVWSRLLKWLGHNRTIRD